MANEVREPKTMRATTGAADLMTIENARGDDSGPIFLALGGAAFVDRAHGFSGDAPGLGTFQNQKPNSLSNEPFRVTHRYAADLEGRPAFITE